MVGIGWDIGAGVGLGAPENKSEVVGGSSMGPTLQSKIVCPRTRDTDERFGGSMIVHTKGYATWI